MTKQQQLDQALAARHQLLIGTATVSVGYGERRAEFTAASIDRLDAYIAELRREIAGTKKSSRNRIRYGVPD